MALNLKSKAGGLISKLKEGSKFNPEGQIASKAYKIGKKFALGTGAMFGVAALYFAHLGAAALKGFIIGATIGGTGGAVTGAVLGAQVGAAIGTVIIPIPIVGTLLGGAIGGVIGGATGFFIGATIGGVTGGLIALGAASGSATITSMGVGAGAGGIIGGYIGGAVGATIGVGIATGFMTIAVAACAATAIGCVLVPIATVSAPIIVASSTAIGAAIGAVGGAIIGAGIGYVVGNYVLEPVKDFVSTALVKVKGFFSGTQAHIESAAGTGQGWAGSTLGSGIGHLTGLVSAGWNGFIGGVGNAIGWGSSLVNSAVGLISGGGTSAATATVAKVAVGGAVSSVATATVVAGIVTNTTFFNPGGDAEDITPPGDNQSFTITKTVDKSSITNPDILIPTPVKFTVTLTAKGKGLSSIHFTDKMTYTKGATTTAITSVKEGPIDGLFAGCITLAASANCTIIFTLDVVAPYSDSTIVNTVTAFATPEGQTEISDNATASVVVGNAPANCPQGWPSTGHITQGPEGGTSHADAIYGGYEAIDIGEVIGQPVYATIDGVVNDQGEKTSLDKRLGIVPTGCPSLNIVNFWHMSTKLVTDGQTVKRGDKIGEVGAYMLNGVPQPHTHYQFNETGNRTFPIEPPNIPVFVPRTCNSPSECNVQITSAP